MLKKFKTFDNYNSKLNELFQNIIVTDNNNKEISIEKGLKTIKEKITKNNVFLVGNGGSSSNCDHISNDFSKILNAKSINLYGSGVFTCYANDYGFENVFSQQLKTIGKKKDNLICLSCSGESQNIINAMKVAKSKSMFTITFTGISKKNQIRRKGNINFYVDSSSYGLIEIAHLTLLHYLVEN
tara:strand:+ start:5537 stop:6088 length:552 start_codon:yes stop_codon:yes gene_type:complete